MISETIKCNKNKTEVRWLSCVFCYSYTAFYCQQIPRKEKINTTIVNLSTYEGQKMHK